MKLENCKKCWFLLSSWFTDNLKSITDHCTRCWNQLIQLCNKCRILTLLPDCINGGQLAVVVLCSQQPLSVLIREQTRFSQQGLVLQLSTGEFPVNRLQTQQEHPMTKPATSHRVTTGYALWFTSLNCGVVTVAMGPRPSKAGPCCRPGWAAERKAGGHERCRVSHQSTGHQPEAAGWSPIGPALQTG